MNKLLLVLLSTVFLVANDEFKYNISVQVGNIGIQGDYKLGDNNSNHTFSTIGIGYSQHIKTPTINVMYNNHQLYTSFFSINYNTKYLLSQDIIKDNIKYEKGINIDTKLENNFISFGYKYKKNNVLFGYSIHRYHYFLGLSDKLNKTKVEDTYLFPTLDIDVSNKSGIYSLDYGANIGDGSNMNYFNFYFSGGFDFIYIKKSKLSLGYRLSEFYINDAIYETMHRYKGTFLKLEVNF